MRLLGLGRSRAGSFGASRPRFLSSPLGDASRLRDLFPRVEFLVVILGGDLYPRLGGVMLLGRRRLCCNSCAASLPRHGFRRLTRFPSASGTRESPVYHHSSLRTPWSVYACNYSGKRVLHRMRCKVLFVLRNGESLSKLVVGNHFPWSSLRSQIQDIHFCLLVLYSHQLLCCDYCYCYCCSSSPQQVCCCCYYCC